ncbi:hypothetical protein QLG10_28415, partial [Pseudomonas sp. V98_8]|uniref:hypothetical protein n=1 Tax=Pseudomonas sp. V98_8 TaxID=3044228 RepID=UPI00249F6E20
QVLVTARSWKFESSSGHQIQIQGFGLEFHRNPRKRVFAFLAPVGAAEGCDLLILVFKIKRSQPSAAPTDQLLRPERI